MSTNDYVKYITQTFVRHFDTPKNTRREMKMQKKQEKAPLLYRWFGVVPYSFLMLFKKK